MHKLSEPAEKFTNTRAFLARVGEAFSRHPFKPFSIFRGGHAQTLAAFAWPGRRPRALKDEERFLRVAPDVQVLAHCRWQPDRKAHPTMIIWHGVEGSSSSTYMISTAHKAFQKGFNVVRMNLRTCGGTEHLTPTIYHGGLTEDLKATVKEFIEQDGLSRLFLVGFSLGGNMVLKLAGEYGDEPPAEVIGICAVSPSVDLHASAELIIKPSNWLYNRDFVYRLKERARKKHELFPELYDISGLDEVHTLREFDDRYTARAHGFDGADDYYYRASSIRVIDRIRIPTLMIHAVDDPFIPFAPLRDERIANNPYILLIATERGGHVAFVASGKNSDADRFWAENRVVEFCEMAEQTQL
ncbi:MAG TPA: alpha/beta fold hydrolase [Pyrinomonadaceae bacterium]|nr:alpha/beta fold hydrolase [Pyrinomonadaceae bacterium]